jgi:quercetin dioxygenase-like cupin family protein
MYVRSSVNFIANVTSAMRSGVPAILAGFALAAGAVSASAGECPADKVLTKQRDIGDHKNNLTTKKTLTVIKLTGWRNIDDLNLRIRYFTIPVGGVVPTHEHDDRPSIVHILQGEIVEHNALCAVPIVHKAGETTPEFGKGHAHWWENTGSVPVLLTSSDIVETGQLDKDMPDM